ncbi:MAG TPA: AraC family transcriptional regulator [Blastocatellia bacterium]|nr:AraC family transcriptional regulator [Blastocatellia bacterium]
MQSGLVIYSGDGDPGNTSLSGKDYPPMSLQLPPGRLFGQTLRSRKIASFELSERVYPPGYHTPHHSHKQPLFCYVMQGEYTEKFGSQMRECTPSTLLFHPAEELHAEYFHDAGGRSFIIEIAPEWLAHVREHVTLSNQSADFRGGTLELLARKLYREFAQMDQASSLIIEGLMLEMMGESARLCAANGRGAPLRWLRQARDLLESRFTENLSLSEVARNVGVHPVHLAQSFHKTYASTVGEYVRKLRIDYACRELMLSDRPIVEIALTAGFCDQSHFTRTFKRLIGISPTQYREANHSQGVPRPRPNGHLV